MPQATVPEDEGASGPFSSVGHRKAVRRAEALQKDNAALVSTNTAHHAEIERLKRNIGKLDEVNEAQRGETDRLKRDLRRAETDRDVLMERIERQKTSADGLLKSISGLEQNDHNLRGELETVRWHRDTAESDLAHARSHIKVLNERIETLELARNWSAGHPVEYKSANHVTVTYPDGTVTRTHPREGASAEDVTTTFPSDVVKGLKADLIRERDNVAKFCESTRDMRLQLDHAKRKAERLEAQNARLADRIQELEQIKDWTAANPAPGGTAVTRNGSKITVSGFDEREDTVTVKRSTLNALRYVGHEVADALKQLQESASGNYRDGRKAVRELIKTLDNHEHSGESK